MTEVPLPADEKDRTSVDELPKTKEDKNDDGTGSSDEDIKESSKELGLVISALQSTVNQKKQTKAPQVEPEGEEPTEDLRSLTVEDSESDAKNSMEDNNSISTLATSKEEEEEEEKEEEKVPIPQTFEEIVQDIVPPTPGIPPERQSLDFGANDDVADIDGHSANLIALNKINAKEIKANTLSPRDQERAGKG
jgi:hypothetical protein